MIQNKILQQADKIINKDRMEEYGPPSESFKRIAELWTSYFDNKITITETDVAHMMILLKVSRAKGQNLENSDSHVDIAGYAALAAELAKPYTVVVDTVLRPKTNETPPFIEMGQKRYLTCELCAKYGGR